MKYINQNKRKWVNDVEDLTLSNIYITKTERELMTDRYLKLRKVSYGTHVRLGFLPTQLW